MLRQLLDGQEIAMFCVYIMRVGGVYRVGVTSCRVGSGGAVYRVGVTSCRVGTGSAVRLCWEGG